MRKLLVLILVAAAFVAATPVSAAPKPGNIFANPSLISRLVAAAKLPQSAFKRHADPWATFR